MSIVIGLRSDGTLEIQIAYDPSLYPQEEIGTVENTFTSILQSMAAQSDARIKDIRIVTEEEQTELIKLGMGERMEYAPPETLVSLFRAQAAKTPDNIAVVFKDRQLTYRDLDDLTLHTLLISTMYSPKRPSVS